jgi:hypothetical protein
MFLCGAGLLPLDCGLSGLLTVNAIFFITVAGPKPSPRRPGPRVPLDGVRVTGGACTGLTPWVTSDWPTVLTHRGPQ